MKQFIYTFVLFASIIVMSGCSQNKLHDQLLQEQMARQRVEARCDSIAHSLNDSLVRMQQQLSTIEQATLENEKRFDDYRRQLATVAIPETVSFCDQQFNFSSDQQKERLERELSFLLENQAQLMLYFKRSVKYFPIIVSILQADSSPTDLKYVAIVESALKPDAHSIAGAVGFWQFMPRTAEGYDLERTNIIDMRKNLEKSTRAASKHFRYLYNLFDDWALVLAANNIGEGALGARMKTQRCNDYFELVLPRETEEYFFRAVAMKLIFENPNQYGVKLETRSYWERIDRDTVTVTVRKKLPFVDVASWCGTSYRQIKLLNPELNQDSWSAGKYLIYLPAGTREQFLDSLQVISGQKKAAKK